MAENFFYVFRIISTVAGCIIALYSVALLLAIWFAPRLLDSHAFSPRITGRFHRTRKNLTIFSCYYLSVGIVLVAIGQELRSPILYPFMAASLILLFPLIGMTLIRRDA